MNRTGRLTRLRWWQRFRKSKARLVRFTQPASGHFQGFYDDPCSEVKPCPSLNPLHLTLYGQCWYRDDELGLLLVDWQPYEGVDGPSPLDAFRNPKETA